MLKSLKFVRHLGSNAAEVPAKFQSDWRILNTCPAYNKTSYVILKWPISKDICGNQLKEIKLCEIVM